MAKNTPQERNRRQWEAFVRLWHHIGLANLISKTGCATVDRVGNNSHTVTFRWWYGPDKP